jgi:hypothetical protein
MDTFLLVAHLSGVALLFIMISIELVALCGAPRAATVARLRASVYAEPAAARIAPVAVLIILVSGLWMVGRSSWVDFSDAWVIVSIVALVVVTILGVGVHGRRLEKLREAAESAPDGPVSAQLQVLIRDQVLHLSAWGSTGSAFSFLYVMVDHPGALWSILAFVIGPVIGVVAGQLLLSRAVAAPEASGTATTPV